MKRFANYDADIYCDNQFSIKMKINKLPVFYDYEMCWEITLIH